MAGGGAVIVCEEVNDGCGDACNDSGELDKNDRSLDSDDVRDNASSPSMMGAGAGTTLSANVTRLPLVGVLSAVGDRSLPLPPSTSFDSVSASGTRWMPAGDEAMSTRDEKVVARVMSLCDGCRSSITSIRVDVGCR